MKTGDICVYFLNQDDRDRGVNSNERVCAAIVTGRTSSPTATAIFISLIEKQNGGFAGAALQDIPQATGIQDCCTGGFWATREQAEGYGVDLSNNSQILEDLLP